MRLTFTLAALVYLSAVTFAFTHQDPAKSAAPPSGRFDFEVRADFFAGLSGDVKRFERAMARCEEVLAQNPNHAEALVWHGSGLLFRAGMLFSKGDTAQGMELWGKGLGEMNRAVALEPDNVGVRIPRGASLFETTRFVPDPQQMPRLKLALDDYEHVLKLQESYFAKLSDHAKGELLFGLADGWARAGDKQKAQAYFTRLTQDATKSGRVEYAKAWLEGTPPADPGRCVGCH
jgi:tetratricopeptide (TPR) repeat protein